MAASSCLLAALALGVAACGGDDEPSDDGSGGGGSGEAAGKTLTIYSSVPLQGASRVQTEARRQRREARARAGRQQGRPAHDQVRARSTTPRLRPATGRRRRTSANARKAAQDDSTAVYIGDVQLGRGDGLDPDPQRGRRPEISPGQHGRGPDHRRAGLRARRAGQVLPDRHAHLHAHRPEGHDPGLPRSSR